MSEIERLAKEHTDITRRYFLQLGAIGATAVSIPQLWAQEDEGEDHALLAEVISKLEYLTREENFITYGRGKPSPHKLPL